MFTSLRTFLSVQSNMHIQVHKMNRRRDKKTTMIVYLKLIAHFDQIYWPTIGDCLFREKIAFNYLIILGNSRSVCFHKFLYIWRFSICSRMNTFGHNIKFICFYQYLSTQVGLYQYLPRYKARIIIRYKINHKETLWKHSGLIICV